MIAGTTTTTTWMPSRASASPRLHRHAVLASMMHYPSAFAAGLAASAKKRFRIARVDADVWPLGPRDRSSG